MHAASHSLFCCFPPGEDEATMQGQILEFLESPGNPCDTERCVRPNISSRAAVQRKAGCLVESSILLSREARYSWDQST